MTSYKKISKIIDFLILFILLLVLVGFFSYDYTIFGLDKPIVALPDNFHHFFEFLPWVLLSLLIADLYIKFILIKNFRKFIRQHWLDIFLSITIPLLYPLKAISFVIKSYKYFKFGKYTYKFFDKFRKLNKGSKKL